MPTDKELSSYAVKQFRKAAAAKKKADARAEKQYKKQEFKLKQQRAREQQKAQRAYIKKTNSINRKKMYK